MHESWLRYYDEQGRPIFWGLARPCLFMSVRQMTHDDVGMCQHIVCTTVSHTLQHILY